MGLCMQCFWMWINWLLIGVCSGLFVWSYIEVLRDLQPHVTERSFGNWYWTGGDWYEKTMEDGDAFWPDTAPILAIVPVCLVLGLSYSCTTSSTTSCNKCYNFWFDLPGILMSLSMWLGVRNCCLLRLDVLPTSPVCGCLNSTFTTLALYDCQCYIPFHGGTARLLTTDPTNVTAHEYLAAGVAEDHIPTGNLTIQYMAETHHLESLRTWDVESLKWECALFQCSIIVLLTRIIPFLIKETKADKLFSHVYYLVSQCLDALVILNEIVEHGDYFVNRTHLTRIIFYPAFQAIMQLAIFPRLPLNRPGKLRLAVKAGVILMVNVVLLLLRCYLASLYKGGVNMIFILFIIREVVMLIFGIMALVFEMKQTDLMDLSDNLDNWSRDSSISMASITY